MTTPQNQEIKIGSDAPQTDPANDAFGYAPFARRIADAVCKTPSPHGLVMAIHGPWGAGKTSLLNFVKHYLTDLTKTDQPIVIDFNPWWFSSKEHLAAQFLSQFRSKLIRETELLRKAGDAMADYAGTIGKTISLTYGIPWLDKPIGFLLKLLKQKKKEVPELKREISEALKKEGRRIVFFIDDIDRLAPDEIRELFKVIKALADFPNVIYVLSFDRKIVADALRASLGIEGEAYLEKIVQAPFSLPAVDRLRLRKKLFTELDEILESRPLRNFDQTHWGNIYFDGLDQYIEKPRDIVRVINALSVTYPAVGGEVNPVDFIALEFLRVFEPEVYSIIRDNRDMFAGSSDSSYRRGNEPEKVFHKTWLEKLNPESHDDVKELVVRLFPKLENVFGNTHYGSSWSAQWRRDLRVCAPEVFDIYFQFGVSTDVLSRAELDELVAVASETEEVIAILQAASSIHRPDGTTKAREILERLRDVVDDLSPVAVTNLLRALFSVGDGLLSSADEQGFLGVPNRWRLHWAVKNLLQKVPVEDKETFLCEITEQGAALALIVQVIDRIEDYLSKQEQTESPYAGIDPATLTALQQIAVRRLGELNPHQLLQITDFPFVVHRWSKWAGDEAVRVAVRPLWDSNDFLPAILEKYLSFGTRQGYGDRVAERVPHLNPKLFQAFTDIAALEPRVQQLLEVANLVADQRAAAETFLKNMQRIAEGKDPDGFFSDDD